MKGDPPKNPKKRVVADVRDLLSPPKGKRKNRAAGGTLNDPAAKFDLWAAIEESRDTYDKKDKDTIKFISLYSVPKYVRANLDRVIAGESVSQEEARWCCIEFGETRISASSEYVEWSKLYEMAISKRTTYRDDGNWDDVQERLNRFLFKPSDLHTGTYTTNARIPEPIRIRLAQTAKVLGMSASVVATIGLIDALRAVDGVMHKDDMDATMNEFYRLLKRRTQRLRNLLVEVEVLEPGQVL